MANKLLYLVTLGIFLLFTVSRVWWETGNGSQVYRRKEWFDNVFESGYAYLRVGFHEDQKYGRSCFLQ
ncbi:Transmembrane protein [Hirschfeldia incana]|nr:Transmembrane protein [Hirschfeldia incana]